MTFSLDASYPSDDYEFHPFRIAGSDTAPTFVFGGNSFTSITREGIGEYSFRLKNNRSSSVDLMIFSNIVSDANNRGYVHVNNYSSSVDKTTALLRLLKVDGTGANLADLNCMGIVIVKRSPHAIGARKYNTAYWSQPDFEIHPFSFNGTPLKWCYGSDSFQSLTRTSLGVFTFSLKNSRASAIDLICVGAGVDNTSGSAAVSFDVDKSNIIARVGATSSTTMLDGQVNGVVIVKASPLERSGQFSKVKYAQNNLQITPFKLFGSNVPGSVVFQHGGEVLSVDTSRAVNVDFFISPKKTPFSSSVVCIANAGNTANTSETYITSVTSPSRPDGFHIRSRNSTGTATATVIHGLIISRKMAPFWTPKNDPKAIIWYDFSDTRTFTIPASGASSLTNKINSSTYTLVQATDADRPGVGSYGRATARGTGSGLNFEAGVGGTIPFVNGAYSVHFCGAFNAFTADQWKQIFAVIDEDGTTSLHAIFLSATANDAVFKATDDGNVNADMTMITGFTPGTSRVLSATFDGVITKRSWSNGASPVTQTDANNGPATTGQQFRILSAGVGHQLCDFCISSAIDDDTRLKYEGFLAWKHPVVTSLPSTHPYRNNPPRLRD